MGRWMKGIGQRGRRNKYKGDDVAPRKCLKCRKTFLSEHKFNRVCIPCRDANKQERPDLEGVSA